MEDAARNIRGVRLSTSQSFECGLFVIEGGQEAVRELCRVEWTARQFRYFLFDFNRIHPDLAPRHRLIFSALPYSLLRKKVTQTQTVTQIFGRADPIGEFTAGSGGCPPASGSRAVILLCLLFLGHRSSLTKALRAAKPVDFHEAAERPSQC